MALTATQYSSMKLALRALLSGNRFAATPNLGESDLLGFWNQLGSEAATAASLPAAQDAAIDFVFRSRLCVGLAARVPDADWATFGTQLGTDAAGAAALPAAQYAQLKLQLRAILSAYSLAPGTVSEATLLGYLKSRTALNPLTIITSVTVRLWLRADLGVTILSGVSSWTDQAFGLAFTQGTASARPTLNAADSSLNNLATITGDGADDSLVGSLTIAASYYRSGIAKYNAFSVNDRLLDASGKAILLGQGSPLVILFENGLTTPNNAGFGSVGTWKRFAEQQSNAVTDRLLIGSTNATGVALGRTASTSGMTIFSGAGAFFSSAALRELVITDGIPTVPEQTALDAYYSASCGPSVLS